MQNHIKKKIFYWSPGFVHIATFKAVINSAFSINKYSNDKVSFLLNFFGEFNPYFDQIEKKKLNLINFYNEKIIKFFPRYGFINSRVSFLLIFILSFFVLKKKLDQEKPEYLIIHQISSLPLILLIFFKFKTKFVLRISGYPKLNFIRKNLWKFALKKIHSVTCPTKLTVKKLINEKIVDNEKIFLLYDPIIEVNINKKKNFKKENFLLSIGRLTKQKNFIFLCKCIFNLKKKGFSNLILYIAGEGGEEQKKINRYIHNNDLKKNIFLIGHKKNIYDYISRARAVIIPSLYEDPGFVLIEAAYLRTLVISSDCINGPREIIKKNVNGIQFQSDNIESFLFEYSKFDKLKIDDINLIIKKNFLKIKEFTVYNHFKNLNKILC